jgi:hypothetical protein
MGEDGGGGGEGGDAVDLGCGCQHVAHRIRFDINSVKLSLSMAIFRHFSPSLRRLLACTLPQLLPPPCSHSLLRSMHPILPSPCAFFSLAALVLPCPASPPLKPRFPHPCLSLTPHACHCCLTDPFSPAASVLPSPASTPRIARLQPPPPPPVRSPASPPSLPQSSRRPQTPRACHVTAASPTPCLYTLPMGAFPAE